MASWVMLDMTQQPSTFFLFILLKLSGKNKHTKIKIILLSDTVAGENPLNNATHQ